MNARQVAPPRTRSTTRGVRVASGRSTSDGNGNGSGDLPEPAALLDCGINEVFDATKQIHQLREQVERIADSLFGSEDTSGAGGAASPQPEGRAYLANHAAHELTQAIDQLRSQINRLTRL